MNATAPKCVRLATRCAIYLPLAGAGLLIARSIASRGAVSAFTPAITALALIAFAALALLYHSLFSDPSKTSEIGVRSSSPVAIFGIYAAVYIPFMTGMIPLPGLVMVSASEDIVFFMTWFVIGLVPIFACLLQAAMPEALWSVEPRWPDRMLGASIFMLGIHFALTVFALSAITTIGSLVRLP
ncbi:hypothetical protein [Falsirhodobacter xinxiangensis]|uniref:hypothetical protein n=1 Tax=Falsirhodobacter xinxiangensis TaxID=2530049 RepID=UPI0010AB33FF|nr:hypothetical protein [Rhodobacter xinxiangensis]